MPDENLLATLEGSLRQTRATRARLAGRLLELELEADKLRTEIGEMDQIASQTQAAMFRIMSSVLNSDAASAQNQGRGYDLGSSYKRMPPSDAQIEAALREDRAREERAREAAETFDSGAKSNSQRVAPAPPSPIRPTPPPALRQIVEPQDERFNDRTIPQAAAMLLREEGSPLHVNEIYNRLLEGGFQFTGQNPTISIAVSLNRNRRFRKVAPGTFDLMIRDAAQAS